MKVLKPIIYIHLNLFEKKNLIKTPSIFYVPTLIGKVELFGLKFPIKFDMGELMIINDALGEGEYYPYPTPIFYLSLHNELTQ